MDTRFPSRRLTVGCLVAAAALMLAGLGATPWEDDRSVAAYHDALAAHPDQAQVAASLLHFGYLLLVPACFGLVSAAGGRGGWWTRVGAVLTVAGLVSLPGLLITDAYDLALAQEFDREMSVRLSDAASSTVLAGIIAAPAGLGLMGGTVLLVAGLLRARVVPRLALVLVVAGWAVPLAGFDLVLTMVGAVLFTAGCVLIARRLLAAADPAATAAAVLAEGVA